MLGAGGAWVRPAHAVTLDEPASGEAITGELQFSWTLGEDDYEPIVQVYDQPPAPGVAPVWREKAYDDYDDYSELDGPDLPPGRHWWTVSGSTSDGRSAAPARAFDLVATHLTRFAVSPSVGSGSVRLVATANGFNGVAVSGEVRWRGRVIWSGDAYDPGGAALRRVEYPYNCRRAHPGPVQYRVTVVDSFATTLVRTGSFREANCGNTPSPGESVYFPSRCTNQSIRPRSVVVACGDGNFQLRNLRVA